MSCKPKAKSLRAADGMELINRFAKRGGVIRAEDGVEVVPRPMRSTYSDPAQMAVGMPQMADGGEIHAADGFLGNLRKAIMPTDAEKAAKAQYLAESRPAAPAQPQAPQTKAISDYAGNTALSSRMQAAGLRDGGDLRTGHGGNVPGTGHGDKIPAKYEPGEFVVSNDMLDAQPELRQHLRGLREEVLADKGMTVAQADAKAMSGGGLRADVGWGAVADSNEGGAKSTRYHNPIDDAINAEARAPKPGSDLASKGAVLKAMATDAASLFDLKTGTTGNATKQAIAQQPTQSPSVAAAPTPAPAGANYSQANAAQRSLRLGDPSSSDLKDEFSNAMIENRNPGGKVTKVGNSYSGGNVSGEVSFQGADGNALRGRPGGGFMVTSGGGADTSALNNPDGSKWSAGDNAIMAANLRDGVDKYRGTSRDQANAGRDEFSHLPFKVAAQMRVAKMQNETSLRTTSMNNETQLMGNKMNNAFNARKFQVEQGNKNREYELDVQKYGTEVADKNRAASESSAKAFNTRMENMWRTNVDGKDVPDTAKIARYSQNVENTIPDIIAGLVKTGTPAALAKAKDVQARGKAALDDSDHATLRQMQMRQDRLEGTHGAVTGSTHKKSASLMGYGQKAGTDARDGNYYFDNGSMAPAKHMLYDEPGNFMMPDWFKRKDDTLTRGLWTGQ